MFLKCQPRAVHLKTQSVTPIIFCEHAVQELGVLCCKLAERQTCVEVCGNDAILGMQVGLFCVFDGHCGRRTAEEAKRLLAGELSERLHHAVDELREGIGAGSLWEDVFLATDKVGAGLSFQALKPHRESWSCCLG